MNLNYRDSRPIYVQIADGYRTQIAAGVLRKNDKLPSVRELAVQMSINPNTIQRAYRQLEMEGWILTIPGKGCFVCGVPQGNPEEEVKLLKTLADTAARLRHLGYTNEELIAHIVKEEDHA